MEYPFLHWNFWGGGLLIALVATIHVFIAHFAVGGGLFIAVMETRLRRSGIAGHEDFLRAFAKFFLVFTLVAGGLTGVGIWFTISVTAPAATSTLIHGFVLGWATEWAFFLAEIVTILAYIRSFGGSSGNGLARRRLVLAWLYFAFAWGSLAVVQGFISFMLTPGEWLQTHRYWDGFLNPTYFPGLAFRTAVAAVLAGVFGLATVQGFAAEADRKRLSRFCALWTLLPLPVVVAAGWWQIAVLSPEQQALAMGRSPEVAAGMRVFWWALPCLLAGGALLAGGLPRRAARLAAGATLAASFAFLGSYEYMREAARRPYLVTGHLYSSGIPVDRAPEINAKGALASARWSRVKSVTPENPMLAGEELYYLQCASCHSRGGPLLDIVPLSAKYSPSGMEALLTGLGKVGRYMPPFLGTALEKKALAAWLTEGLHGAGAGGGVSIAQSAEAVPAFDADKALYVLAAVADRGINMHLDAGGRIALAGPGGGAQGLTAHLVRRDASPQLVTEGFTLTYAVEGQAAGSLNPSGRAFRAEGIRVSPYPAAGGFQPYPVAVVQAQDASGKVVAETKVVLPVSTEMGCKNCHGGGWTHGVAGVSPATAGDALKAHDRLNLTVLSKGKGPVECASCHRGDGERLNLSAAVHGLHAVYLAGRAGDACNMCHPTDPKGATRALRDPHFSAGFDCTNCHGAMEDHALSLLAREEARGVKAAGALMKLIPPRSGTTSPREPWVQQPKCLTCHQGYGPPQNDQAFGTWTRGAGELFKTKTDDLGGLTCAACHGAAHAVYPAANPYGKQRDVLQPLQYQGAAKALGGGKNCKACHTVDMDAAAHHPGMGVE